MPALKRYADRVRERHDKLTAALDGFLKVCRDDSSVRAVYVFGSYATGNVGPTSDIDVLLVRETRQFGHARGADLLSAGAGATIDLLVVTPEEFTGRLAATSFGRTIVSSMWRVDAA